MKSKKLHRRRPKLKLKERERLRELQLSSTPLRERYIADLRLHRFSEATVKNYLNEMLRLTACTCKSPAILSDEELRNYFDYLENKLHYSHSILGIAFSASNFFYTHTCPRDMPFLRIFRHRRDKTLPIVLSREEVRKALAKVEDIRYHACLALIYSCGLRGSEGTNVKIGDIDAPQGLLYIRKGKGGKPRSVPLAERTLQILRNMWQTHRHPQLLFPAYRFVRNPVYRRYGCQDRPFTAGALHPHFKNALAASGCYKDPSVHSLRHSFATHLLEEGIPLFTVKEYLGHANISSTMKYTHMTHKIRRDGAGTLEALMSDL